MKLTLSKRDGLIKLLDSQVKENEFDFMAKTLAIQQESVQELLDLYEATGQLDDLIKANEDYLLKKPYFTKSKKDFDTNPFQNVKKQQTDVKPPKLSKTIKTVKQTTKKLIVPGLEIGMLNKFNQESEKQETFKKVQRILARR